MGTLFLVRHGQASAFDDNYDRLSTLGERQARLLGEDWKRRGLALDRVFTGPRVRQQRTAEIAGDAGGLPPPVVVPELDEMQVEPLFREHMPWSADWFQGAELSDEHGWLVGAVTPTVLIWIQTAPGSTANAAPSSPNIVSSTALPSESIVTTTSAP